jgi:CDGSH-type Zn-finger protein
MRTIPLIEVHVIESSEPPNRVGEVSNKPFCDGTHATIDFDGTLAN